MGLSARLGALLLYIATLAAPAAANDAQADKWGPLKKFIGNWSGTTSGQAGDGTVSRSYRLVMNGKYIQESNTSTYPPQEKNKAGEVHEHLGMFSFDKIGKTFVLRQFHVEGFVNTYRQTPGGVQLVFDSESFENFSNSWKARESYEFVSDDEFIETFELAAPGKPYQTYSRNHFKRVSK